MNETAEDFWDYQEQVSNGFQEININNNTNIVEKRFRLIYSYLHIYLTYVYTNYVKVPN